jgi:MYXO-CTERM domain-containing protein
MGDSPANKEIEMRAIVAALMVTVAVSFGGAGVANATTFSDSSKVPVATTTTLAQQDEEADGDNTGLWGLAGLLGLVGLLGLKRRNDVDRRVGPAAAPGRGTNPGV